MATQIRRQRERDERRQRIVTAARDLAEALGQARARSAPGTAPQQVLRAVLAAYLAFAAGHPAVYDAMFSQPVAEPPPPPPPPAPPAGAFGVIAAVVEPLAVHQDPAALAEVVWSAVHGIASLTRTGFLPLAAAQGRLDVLAGLVA